MFAPTPNANRSVTRCCAILFWMLFLFVFASLLLFRVILLSTPCTIRTICAGIKVDSRYDFHILRVFNSSEYRFGIDNRHPNNRDCRSKCGRSTFNNLAFHFHFQLQFRFFRVNKWWSSNNHNVKYLDDVRGSCAWKTMFSRDRYG